MLVTESDVPAGHAHPSIWGVIEWCQQEEATVRTIIQQDVVGNPPVKHTQQRHQSNLGAQLPLVGHHGIVF
jgi:hypothetical protein